MLMFYQDEGGRGVYALLNNYISLVVRMIFLPVEEVSRLKFARNENGLEWW